MEGHSAGNTWSQTCSPDLPDAKSCADCGVAASLPGTLTQNEMVFKRLHLGTVSYGTDTMDEIQNHVRNSYSQVSSLYSACDLGQKCWVKLSLSCADPEPSWRDPCPTQAFDSMPTSQNVSESITGKVWEGFDQFHKICRLHPTSGFLFSTVSHQVCVFHFQLFLPEFRYSVSISKENWEVNNIQNLQKTELVKTWIW